MDILKLLPFLGGAPLGMAANGKPEYAAGFISPAAAAGKAILGGGKGGAGPLDAAAPNQRPNPLDVARSAPPGAMGMGSGVLAGGPADTPPIAGMGAEAPEQPSGILGRINDFRTSDSGRAALLRAGAAMLASGNVGEGILAGADYYDRRRMQDQATARDERDYKLRERGVDVRERQGDEGLGLRRDQLEQQWELAQQGNDLAVRRLEQNGYQFDATMSFREAEAQRNQSNFDRNMSWNREKFGRSEAGKNARAAAARSAGGVLGGKPVTQLPAAPPLPPPQ